MIEKMLEFVAGHYVDIGRATRIEKVVQAVVRFATKDEVRVNGALGVYGLLPLPVSKDLS
jgi:hypothetical protein